MKLIYYSISGNSEYVKLIEMSINSLLKNGYNGDILIICDENIKNILQLNYENLLYMIIDKVDSHQSSGNKLRIYEYEKLENYDKILYLDCDILITKNIDLLFLECNEDKFVVSSESEELKETIILVHWAGPLLSLEEKKLYENIKSINAGVFLFNNIPSNLELLKKTYEMFIDKEKYPCYEQPYLNYNLLINNKFIHSLQKYITHHSYYNFDENKIINHYCGGPGNFTLKYHTMKRDYEKTILKNDI